MGALTGDIETALREDAVQLWPKQWNEIIARFDKACFAISVDVIMQHLGLFHKANDFETLHSIREKVKLFEHAEYVFVKMLDILCEEKVLKKRDGGYVCLDAYIEIENPFEILTASAHTLPKEGYCFQWLARAFGSMLHFIKGDLYGEEILFPFNDIGLLEKMYYTSDVTSYYPRLAGKAIKRIVEEEYGKVTILEVGAGTGNSADNVLCQLENPGDYINKYYFTDVSKSIVKRSKQKFDKFDFMEYGILDLGQADTSQTLAHYRADIVFGVNVLHATNDLSVSTRVLNELVKKGGVLVLGEIAPPKNGMYRFMELTFGLLRSYYHRTDTDLRPDYPILRAQQWSEVLKRAGFSQVTVIPGEQNDDCDRGGIVIATK